MTDKADLEQVAGHLAALSEQEVSLNPPMTTAERVMLLACLGDLVPADLLNWLSTHNGAYGSIGPRMGFSLCLMPSKEIGSSYVRYNTFDRLDDADHVKGPVKPTMCFRRRVPFAYLNDLPVFLDYDPPNTGTLGQAILIDVECSSMMWLSPSVLELLNEALRRLRDS